VVPSVAVRAARSSVRITGPSKPTTTARAVITTQDDTAETNSTFTRSYRSARTPANVENTMRGIQPAAVVAAIQPGEPVRS
jgi:hypothetical protein